MNIVNTKNLHAAFPRLYRGFWDEETQLCLNKFRVRDGWYQLIFNLSLSVESRAHTLLIGIDTDAWPVVTEVKQKFSLLSFKLIAPDDLDGSNSIQVIARTYEQRSSIVCEDCGSDGQMHSYRWGFIRALCEFHHNQFEIFVKKGTDYEQGN